MRLFIKSGLLPLLLGLSTAVPAQEASERFQARSTLGLGVAYTTADAKLRASSDPLPEVGLDLEDLGMGRDDWSWALEWRWRFKPKWMLVALAYTFEQSGNRTSQRDFNFDGTEFQAGTSLDTEFSLDTYIIDLMYSVYQGQNLEVLLGGGIHAIDMETVISGSAFVGEVERESDRGNSNLLAPLPNLRAQAFYALSDNWRLGLSTGWLSANYEEFEGSFVYAHPRVGYTFSDKWAVTLGYQFVDIDVSQEKSSTRETKLEIQFSGPTAFLNYRF